MILDEVKKTYVKDLLRHGKRADGRGLLDYRDIKIEKGVLPNAEGSAMVTLGGTKVVAGVKFDLAVPFKDRPEEGIFMVNAEFTPGAHPEFEAGPPGENSIELARVVDRGIRSAEVVDVKKLFIEEGKVYGLFVDLYILDHLGNLTDAASMAAMAALLDSKVPKYEKEQLSRDKYTGPLEVSKRVVTCTFEKIDGKLVLDPTVEEEIASDGRVTLASAEGGLIVAGQKSGRAGFSREEMMQLIDLSLEKGRELAEKL